MPGILHRVMSEKNVGRPLSAYNNCFPCRIRLTDEKLRAMSLEDMIRKWYEQELYVDALETQVTVKKSERDYLHMSLEQMRQQLQEAIHKEKVLTRKLVIRELEIQDLSNQLGEFKAGQSAGPSAFRSALLDPAVNLLLQRLRGELLSVENTLHETRNELSAWKFTPDSNTGKLLMAKCRLLYQENEELGTMISSGRIAKLEGELALQKSFSDEVKKSQSELDAFLQELDEDVEGMQSTIYHLQQELIKSKGIQLTAAESGSTYTQTAKE